MKQPALLTKIAELRAEHADAQVVLVPTMGTLHAGHLRLVEIAREIAGATGKVCVSIFVNPLQFDQPDDLAAYPHSLAEDCAALAGLADTVYAPDAAEIYPQSQQIMVTAPGLDSLLEGAQRPGHFAGVLTVVTKLFCMIDPAVAVFGRKDYQQLVLVRLLSEQLGLRVRIKEVAVVRNRDGLALSSRNSRLTEAQRRQAAVIHQALLAAAAAVTAGINPADACREAEGKINAAGLQTGYVRCVAQGSLVEVNEPIEKDCVLLAAATLAGVRLIDCVATDDL